MDFDELNPLLHSQLRLAIMSLLISTESAEFTDIKAQTKATAGNLSVQIEKLSKANYLSVVKGYKGKRPLTTCRITHEGQEAFNAYVKALQSYLQRPL